MRVVPLSIHNCVMVAEPVLCVPAMNMYMFYAARFTSFNCYLFSMQVIRLAIFGLIKLLLIQTQLLCERWVLPSFLYYDLLIYPISKM